MAALSEPQLSELLNRDVHLSVLPGALPSPGTIDICCEDHPGHCGGLAASLASS